MVRLLQLHGLGFNIVRVLQSTWARFQHSEGSTWVRFQHSEGSTWVRFQHSEGSTNYMG